MFVIISGRNLLVYKYDTKKMSQVPSICYQVSLDAEPKFLQITRDSTITVLF